MPCRHRWFSAPSRDCASSRGDRAMSDFDNELHNRLAARADAVPVTEEWDDLLDRVIRKSRRTTRGLALVTVLAVCFGALGVVVVARDTNSTKPKEKAAPPPSDRVDATHAQI